VIKSPACPRRPEVVTVRFSPAENDALRYAARHLQAPIGALIRYMLLPVFQSYSSDIGAIRPPPFAPLGPGELPAVGALSFERREYMRQYAIDKLRRSLVTAAPANAHDAEGRSSESPPGRRWFTD
jgi:hypothetical protein